ncbi:MAG TPA: cofactor-independent phosphoglycerate mutase [Syntrophaceae bacterium]|nr:cofactor-independent phosphoglycerate mutase [Syntrophaceae bacterium]
MKYIILVGDGMGDYPIPELGNKTPLEIADTPYMDFVAREGEVGMVKTIPNDLEAGSDIANLSILGYDPRLYHTGRAPLEAASLGISLGEGDVAFRCNLVTLSRTSDNRVYLIDYSAGHIPTEEARELILDLDQKLGDENFRFYPGISYRHILVWHKGDETVNTIPPHDWTGKEVTHYLNDNGKKRPLLRLMEKAESILRQSPLNKSNANSIWLWGQGKAPHMPRFYEKYHKTGAIISAVDLLKGIGIYAGLEVVSVPGATGYLDTNYKGKAKYALKILKDKDLVYVHVEAPDEASHNGRLEDKIGAIENFDRLVVKTILEGLEQLKMYKIMIITDHFTPLSLKTHTQDPVPFAIYSPGVTNMETRFRGFSEKEGQRSPIFIEEGFRLMDRFIGDNH